MHSKLPDAGGTTAGNGDVRRPEKNRRRRETVLIPQRVTCLFKSFSKANSQLLTTLYSGGELFLCLTYHNVMKTYGE